MPIPSMHRLIVVVALALSAIAQATAGPLVDARSLARELGAADLLVLDASPAPVHAKAHIPGAVPVDTMALTSFGAREVPVAQIERTYRALGIDPSKRVVIYDTGGTWFAARVFFALYDHGFPVERLAILDGGLEKWRAERLPLTADATPAPTPGTFRVAPRDDARASVPDLLAASGDRSGRVLVDALGPEYYYGAAKFFDRGGHLPHAALLPAEDFFNADKTFKSPDAIRRMAAFQGVGPDREVLTYCGGGGAAAVPYFALRFVAGYPRVRLSPESEYGWLQDDRELPMWTYATPSMLRQPTWLQAWGGKSMRMFGLARVSIVDLRSDDAYAQGHLPFSVHVPADAFRAGASDPAALAQRLGAAGVDPAHEVVLVSGAGVTREAALAYAVLERIGQTKASVLVASLDSIEALEAMARADFALTKEPTRLPARSYPAQPRATTAFAVPPATVFVASGATLPANPPAGKVVHLPAAQLVNADGTPKSAAAIWALLAKAGVPRDAALVTIADDPADAALNYYVLRLMGFPQVTARLV
jgi:thiosulfate/3-mercaptopyruvate sulfurtransferase